MNIINLPITVLDNIINNITDTSTFSNLRLTCKSFYFIVNDIKRFYNNNQIKEQFTFKKNKLHGYHINWYINGNVSNMSFYEESFKENQYLEYYPNTNIKKIQYYKNGKLNGVERLFLNSYMWKTSEYKDDTKINNEIIYRKDKSIQFKKTFIGDYYKLIYYDLHYRIITAYYVNELIQGNLVINILNNPKLNYNKIIKNYDYGELKIMCKFYETNLLEKIHFKNGIYHGWYYRWDNYHRIKELCYFNNGTIDGTLKIWNYDYEYVEYINYNNGILDGNYKIISKFTTKTIPFKNNLIDGFVVDNFKDMNLTHKIKFKNNLFDHSITKKSNNYFIEIFIDINYFNYIKYKNDIKLFSFKIINNFVSLLYYNDLGRIIFTYTKNLDNILSPYV